MKSIIRKILAVVLLSASTLALAAEDITILWGFNIGSNQANTVRLLIEQLNKTQSKYNFIIGHKPGAGGTISANTVDANPQNTLVSMSSSFIIRPYFEKSQSTHNLDNFKPILVQATGAPMYFLSKKYTSIDQLLITPNVSIEIGRAHV